MLHQTYCLQYILYMVFIKYPDSLCCPGTVSAYNAKSLNLICILYIYSVMYCDFGPQLLTIVTQYRVQYVL